MNIFETAKPGLALLRKVFPEPLLEPERMGDLFPDLGKRLLERERMEVLPRVEVETDSHPQLEPDWSRASEISADVLAWYVPYAIGGDDYWGIYFAADKIEDFAERVYALSYLVRPDITRNQVRAFIWDSVARHEVEHSVQELAVARLLLNAHGLPAKVAPTFLRDGGPIEALAAHYEYTDANYRAAAKGTNKASAYLVHLVAGLQNVPEYRDWGNLNIIDAENQFEAHYSLSKPKRVMAELRKKTQGKFDSDFLTIPTYLV